MKTLIFTLSIIYSFFAIGQTTDKQIPANVIEAFIKNYDQAQDVDWDAKGKDYFEVEFEINKMEYDIVYNSNGKIIKEKREIDQSELPNPVKNTVADLFKDREIDEVIRLEKDDEVFYIVEFESTLVDDLVVLSKDGKVLDSQKSW